MKKLKKICKEYQKLNLFVSKYNWEGMNFPSEKDG